MHSSIAHRVESKIAIAMSGGVDSSVVAYMLSQSHRYEELVGIHMSNWDYADEIGNVASLRKQKYHERHCWEQDWKDARAVALQLKIPIHHVSFQAEYWNTVFQPHCQQVSQFNTPNPDVDCNRYIKFGVLRDYLKKRFFDIEYLATGHYARLWDRKSSHLPDYLEQALEHEDSTALADYVIQPSNSEKPMLLAASDRSKDQSYFLSMVPADNFSGVLFPLGELNKTPRLKINNSQLDNYLESTSLSVREIAKHANLPNATKKDSVGICFIGKRKYGDFINEYIDPADNCKGKISFNGRSSTSSLVQCINVENNDVVATFDPNVNPSLMYSTIGQGAKIPGATQKWFVVDKQISQTNIHRGKERTSPCILVCPGTHHPSLYSDRLYIRCSELNWIAGGGATNRPPPLPFHTKCRIRHLQALVDCEISFHNSFTSADGCDSFKIRLKTPLRGIAIGQVCVFYSGGEKGDLICLGGGPISRRGPNYWETQKDLPKILHSSGHNDDSIMNTE